MAPFKGFPPGKNRLTRIPSIFFSELLASINHLAELKAVLYAFWFLEQLEGNIRYITWQDYSADAAFMKGLGDQAEARLAEGLRLAVEEGIFLPIERESGKMESAVYFLNTPRGRAAVASYHEGTWSLPEDNDRQEIHLNQERPNIFRLYEENIGPLTPLIADALRDAENQYPYEWIEDAFRAAAANNVRRWRYIESILKSWQEKGRNDSNRRDSQEDRRRYIEGEFADFIKH
jgi:DnaD/phage-associated family protein